MCSCKSCIFLPQDLVLKVTVCPVHVSFLKNIYCMPSSTKSWCSHFAGRQRPAPTSGPAWPPRGHSSPSSRLASTATSPPEPMDTGRSQPAQTQAPHAVTLRGGSHGCASGQALPLSPQRWEPKRGLSVAKRGICKSFLKNVLCCLIFVYFQAKSTNGS